jgi:hypothetical protein
MDERTSILGFKPKSTSREDTQDQLERQMPLTVNFAATASSASRVLLQTTDLELDRCTRFCGHYSALPIQEIDINQNPYCQLESLDPISLSILAGAIDGHATEISVSQTLK